MTSNHSDANVPARPKIIVRAIHPERDAMFHAQAASTTQIRTARNSVTMACSKCYKQTTTDGIVLRKCAKCKSVWYCSKKCQKEDWNLHKNYCHDVERGTSKLTMALLANELLRGHLEVCLSLEFDLVNKPAPDTPFLAAVHIGLEPSDLSVFLSLYKGWYGNTEPEKIQGMLQINAIIPSSPGIIPHPQRLTLWREAREKLCASGQASTPVVIIELHPNDGQGVFASVLPISPVAVAMAKAKQPFEKHSAITGDSQIPMTAASCIEWINGFIRADTKNQLLLRMDLRKEDREIIRAVGRGDDTMAVSVLKDKMAREGLYSSFS